MSPERFQTVTERYRELRIAVLGDFCLDRYLEIDPAREEISIETGLPVYNVSRVRAQAGGAGTILNNLAALGVGLIFPIGFVGEDGEGFELWKALEEQPGVRTEGIVRTGSRRTFTYCKPLLIWKDKPPQELNRLDSKNWEPTPAAVQEEIIRRLMRLKGQTDGIIILDQVDLAATGVATPKVLEAVNSVSHEFQQMKVLADSRRGLREFPPVIFKMNAAELCALAGANQELELARVKTLASGLARKNQRAVFVTLAEKGIVGAGADGELEHVPAFPVRGEIDVVGAGDAVSANLAAALCGGATLREALELANAAASVVVHKLGTTGTASVSELKRLLFPASSD